MKNTENNTENLSASRKIIKLSKPYKYEDVEYTELDLGDFNNFTGKTLRKIDALYRQTAMYPLVQGENTTDYAICAASILSSKPVDFFDDMLAPDILAVRGAIVGFLNKTE